MKSKASSRKTPPFDDLYYQLKTIESALGGLSSLLHSAGSTEESDKPVDLAGIGAIIDFAKNELESIAGYVSEHALRRQ